MTKHTPGPWEKRIDHGQINIVTPDGYEIASIPDPDEDGGRGEEDFKNADLITAAPEMLEALKELVERCSHFKQGIKDVMSLQIEDAEKSIIKAEGKSC